MRRAAIAIVSFLLPLLPAMACGPKMYLFDALARGEYRKAYVKMLLAEGFTPPWMSTPAAASKASADAGTVEEIGGEEREIFSACEPHNCAGHTLVVMFTGAPGTPKAVGLLYVENSGVLLGKPNKAEQAALFEVAKSK